MNPPNFILPNETALDEEGWALIAPYGRWPKKRVVRRHGVLTEENFIQVMDHEAADRMVSKENSLFGKIKRALVGIPVFKGHPDLADHAPETPSAARVKKEALGVVDKVRKTARGLEAHFALLPAGAAAVAREGCQYPSALWLGQPQGESHGVIIFKPFQLLSVGLTAHPNISGVESLANARGAELAKESEPSMKLIAGWLIAQGVALANAAAPTETEVLDAVQELFTSKVGEVTALDHEKSQAASRITALTNENAALQTQVSALQHGHAAAVVDLAITKGKLKPAEREARMAALANSADFARDAGALLGAVAIVKTIGSDNTRSGKILGNEGATGETDPRDEYATAVAEHLKLYPACGPIQAHNAVMKKFPSLAELLKARGEAQAK